MKPSKLTTLDEQSTTTEPEGINLLSVYRSMLRIVGAFRFRGEFQAARHKASKV